MLALGAALLLDAYIKSDFGTAFPLLDFARLNVAACVAKVGCE